MSHVSVAYYSPCPLSNLRNGHVTCHYLLGPHVAVSKVYVALSNLRNVDFRGQGPYHCPTAGILRVYSP